MTLIQMYKLINRKNNEETLCTKIVIDEFDYYKDINHKFIATNYHKSELPKIIDEIKELLMPFPDDTLRDGREIKTWQDGWVIGHIEGYNKSQETHPFNKNDMLDFVKFVNFSLLRNDNNFLNKSFEYMFKKWEEQQIKILYYE